jgi:hypothetical protein
MARAALDTMRTGRRTRGVGQRRASGSARNDTRMGRRQVHGRTSRLRGEPVHPALAAPRCLRRRPGREGGGRSGAEKAAGSLRAGSRHPERTRFHPSSPGVGVRPVLVAVRNYRSPVHWWTGARTRRVRRGGSAANGVRGMGAAPVPPHARPALRPDAGVPARGRPASRLSSSWRHVTMVQRRSLSSGWSACLWPSFLNGVPAIVPGAFGYGLALPVVACSSGSRGSASRSARSSRPMTRSLVSGKRCP